MEREQQTMAFVRSNGIDALSGVTPEEIRDELIEGSLAKPSFERLVFVKDLAERLSEEAREVIRIVLNAPEEMVEYLWGSSEKQITKITRHDLRQYLNWSCGWKFTHIARVFAELERFVKNF